jgi:cytochrome oxidase Cu insertion factor (SCO1/SenC/PrrC family)
LQAELYSGLPSERHSELPSGLYFRGGEVKLLSVSFDPEDSIEDLKHYLTRFSANPSIWSAAKFARQSDLEMIKQQLGLIVIPEPSVGYIHNSAVYVIYDGRVVAILDHDDRKGIRDVISQYLPGTAGSG